MTDEPAGLRSIVVVGASLAGVRAAEELRRLGYDRALTIVGEESHVPYDRPPLSKQLLSGEWAQERLHLPSMSDDYLDADWRRGERATALDLADRSVTLASGESLAYDGLVIATGAAATRLPFGHDLAGVHLLRTLDDGLALLADIEAGPRRVVVIGAGFIGAEVASTCRRRNLAVTLIEALPTPLGRVLGDEIGSMIGAIHQDEGVDLRMGVGVEGIEGSGRVERVRLTDGTTVDADVVVVGIGVRPNTGWLEGSGLTLDDGVVCDPSCLAAPGVVAAGDVARWTNPVFDASMRVEHWDNAIDQGGHAAARLLADAAAPHEPGTPFAPVPWFWSDQYDVKIQMAGRTAQADRVEVVEGSLDEGKFTAFYGRAGRLTGVLGVNRPRRVMQFRRRIADGVTWDEAVAAIAG
jgi:3-phenylpropionate/trans-cinnamate dioxygenase ferredoxin reductase subunit